MFMIRGCTLDQHVFHSSCVSMVHLWPSHCLCGICQKVSRVSSGPALPVHGPTACPEATLRHYPPQASGHSCEDVSTPRQKKAYIDCRRMARVRADLYLGFVFSLRRAWPREPPVCCHDKSRYVIKAIWNATAGQVSLYLWNFSYLLWIEISNLSCSVFFFFFFNVCFKK